jgi:hypothetical protein
MSFKNYDELKLSVVNTPILRKDSAKTLEITGRSTNFNTEKNTFRNSNISIPEQNFNTERKKINLKRSVHFRNSSLIQNYNETNNLKFYDDQSEFLKKFDNKSPKVLKSKNLPKLDFVTDLNENQKSVRETNKKNLPLISGDSSNLSKLEMKSKLTKSKY